MPLCARFTAVYPAALLICLLLFSACAENLGEKLPDISMSPSPSASVTYIPPEEASPTPSQSPAPGLTDGKDTDFYSEPDHDWQAKLTSTPFDETGELISSDTILSLSGADLVYGVTDTGREVIVQRASDYTDEWWELVAENDEFGWHAGPNGAGVDIDTASELSDMLLANQWIIPASGYTLDPESISFLGGGMCYVEAVHSDVSKDNMRLFVAFSLGSDGSASWFPIASSTGGDWERVEG